MFTSTTFYDTAIQTVRDTGFTPDKEKILLGTLEALRDDDQDKLENLSVGLSPEDQDVLSDALLLIMSSTQRKLENDIIVNGSPDEVELLGTIMTAEQAKMNELIEKLSSAPAQMN